MLYATVINILMSKHSCLTNSDQYQATPHLFVRLPRRLFFQLPLREIRLWRIEDVSHE
jgi:hypothetical protein